MVSERPNDHSTRRSNDPQGDVDEPVAAVAHDVRNALATIIGRSQLLSRQIRRNGRAEPGHVLESFAAIERAAVRIADDIGRLDGGVRPRRAGPTSAERAEDGVERQ